ncbi:acyl-CoA synthetase [Archaeoglobales archaeon ex4484_92]|nr:MAG: acyl-CoA synthetase [Archaeoglobales archaeon ex4484_92]
MHDRNRIRVLDMTSIYEKLKYLLRPETVAVIGAAREPHKIGHQVLKNLIEGGFSRNKIFPINPHAESILGLKCYPSVKNVPQPVDMAVIVVPARIVPRVLEDCVEKGVKAVAVISSGFKEIGKAEEEKKLVEIARKGGIRLLGPNIVGICDTVRSMNASFCQELPEKGDIAFITQSGALGIALIGWTKLKHIGLSDLVSIGNKADVDEVDLIEFFGEDPYTKVITLYLEGISRGREFYAIAKKVSKKKPIIILKAGKAERTISAIKSHTGSLAGSDVAYDAAFKQAGVIRAPTFPDLFDWAIAFSKLPLPSGENVVILTNGGGAGVMATDEAEIRGIKLMDIPPDLADKIREYMPPFGSVYNPIDLTGMATKDWYRGSLEVLLEDPRVHAVLVIYCHTAQTEPRDIGDAILEAIKSIGKSKPVVASFIGGKECHKECERLTAEGVPCYESPERAVVALSALYNYWRFLKHKETYPVALDVDKERAYEIIRRAVEEGRKALTAYESAMVAKAYGIPVPEQALAKSEEEAVNVAEKIGYPLVLSIESPHILHKTEVGGVKVGLNSAEEVAKAYNEIMESVAKRAPQAEIRGVVVRKMIPEGREVIIGMHRDPAIGPLLMFGSGGILVELLKDVSFRVSPLSIEDVYEMIKETKAYKMLKGFRGMPEADIEKVVDVILRTAKLAEDIPEILDIDINPVFVFERGKGCLAADVKVVLK